MDEIPEKLKKVFVTAHDITPADHIKMQAAFQKYVDNAVSKTVNFTHNATKEDVKQAYVLSYKLGCKGVTVYRDGSRQDQVLISSSTSSATAAPSQTEPKQESKGKVVKKRPRRVIGSTLLMHTGCGKMYVTINEDEEGNIFEVFTQLGKSGGCISTQTEAIARLISLGLRSGVDPHKIVEQLKGIRCPSPTLTEGGAILSCPDAIAKAIESYLAEKEMPNLFNENTSSVPSAKAVSSSASSEKTKVYKPTASGNSEGTCPQCPECGEMLEFAEGCVVCKSCGYSKCF